MKKVLITAPAHEILMDTLTKNGYSVSYLPAISYHELCEKIEDCFLLVVSTRLPIDAFVMEKAGQLKYIARLGSGMELIDTVFAGSKGITCISSPEGNRNSVAEHTLGLLLGLTKHIVRSNREVRSGKWIRKENRGIELRGKKVGIIGYGNTGSSLAALLRSFGVQVLAYDKYNKGFQNDYVNEVSLEILCRDSDVISFHVPLTDETRGWVDDRFFEKLERRPYFLNTSRGEIVKTASLVRALETGLIRAAALDVLENERIGELTQQESLQFEYLCNHPDVIITPHIAGYSEESYLEMSRVILRKLEVLEGFSE